jgi:hypothetical protein
MYSPLRIMTQTKIKSTTTTPVAECYEFGRVLFEETAGTAGYGFISLSLGGGDIVVFGREADDSERAPDFRVVKAPDAPGGKWTPLCSLWRSKDGILRGVIQPATSMYENSQELLDAMAEDYPPACEGQLSVLCMEDENEESVFNLVAYQARRRNFQR